MKHIKLLDCTLRDGGHLIDSYFGKDVIIDIINKLLDSKINIIEAGFLCDCEFDENVAKYNTIEEAMRILPSLPEDSGTSYSLMAQEDLYDFRKLEYCDGRISVIRISFHDYDLEEGLECAQEIVNKGYRCYINPINTQGYSDEQLLKIIERVNKIEPDGFTIVDTFGAMRKADLLRIYYLVDHNLSPNIKIAIHLHENQSMAFSLAQTFVEISAPTRDICIDGSLYGMGRVPGNLCIELIMNYMNETQGSDYNIEPVYDAVDEYIIDIKKRIPWGYSTAYALSARYFLHRTYAEYLLSKGKLRTKEINQILSMIVPEHKTKFDKDYIEELYQNYKRNLIDDRNSLKTLKEIFAQKSVLLLAPGRSILYEKKEILKAGESVEISVSAGFVWNEMGCDYMFCSNPRRWDMYGRNLGWTKKIITSNLMNMGLSYDYAVNFSDYAYTDGVFLDNCGAMLIKLIGRLGIRKIYLAGFDGFVKGRNFAIEYMEKDRPQDWETEKRVMTQLIAELAKETEVIFLTESAYQQHNASL